MIEINLVSEYKWIQFYVSTFDIIQFSHYSTYDLRFQNFLEEICFLRFPGNWIEGVGAPLHELHILIKNLQKD